jgi:hypothetical protein
MPVNVELAALAELPEVKETGFAPTADGLEADEVADEEAGGVGVDKLDEATAEASTWSTDELSAPHVASSSTA